MHDIIFDTFDFLVEKFHFKFYKIKTGTDFIICYKFYKDDYVFYLKYDCREVYFDFRIFLTTWGEIFDNSYVIIKKEKFYGVQLNTILKNIDSSLEIKPFFTFQNGKYICTYGENTGEYIQKYSFSLINYCDFLLKSDISDFNKFIDLEHREIFLASKNLD